MSSRCYALRVDAADSSAKVWGRNLSGLVPYVLAEISYEASKDRAATILPVPLRRSTSKISIIKSVILHRAAGVVVRRRLAIGI